VDGGETTAAGPARAGWTASNVKASRDTQLADIPHIFISFDVIVRSFLSFSPLLLICEINAIEQG
jgi:hypothetical protein